MPDTGVADNTVLTSAIWDSASRQQVVTQTTDASPPTAVDARLYATTDTDRLMGYVGSTAIRLLPMSSTGRTFALLSRAANQSIPSGTGTFTAISWDTETSDADGFVVAHATTGTTLTVPTNLGGIYAMTATVTWASSPGANSSIEFYVNGATVIRDAIGAGTQMTSSSTSCTYPLNDAQTLQVRVSQGSGGAINVTASLVLVRITP